MEAPTRNNAPLDLLNSNTIELNALVGVTGNSGNSDNRVIMFAIHERKETGGWEKNITFKND